MIKNIVKDLMFLSAKSRKATIEDKETIKDLKDTLMHHSSSCVGMAANMIGKNITMMVILFHNKPLVLINPEIIQTYGNIKTFEEGCLSLKPGEFHETRRYEKIKVKYLDEHYKERIKVFSDIPALSIQHQFDHFQGKIV